LLQFYEGYFYYKYKLYIANLEIEGLKQGFRKTTTKLGFV